MPPATPAGASRPTSVSSSVPGCAPPGGAPPGSLLEAMPFRPPVATVSCCRELTLHIPPSRASRPPASRVAPPRGLPTRPARRAAPGPPSPPARSRDALTWAAHRVVLYQGGLGAFRPLLGDEGDFLVHASVVVGEDAALQREQTPVLALRTCLARTWSPARPRWVLLAPAVRWHCSASSSPHRLVPPPPRSPQALVPVLEPLCAPPPPCSPSSGCKAPLLAQTHPCFPPRAHRPPPLLCVQ